MSTQPFFFLQRLRRLDEEGDVRKYLQPDLFRKRRGSPESIGLPDGGNWVQCDRNTLVAQLGSGDVLRAVLTTDAGIGKTINVEHLQFHLSRKFSNKIVCRVSLGDVETRLSGRILTPSEFLEQYLAEHLKRSAPRLESRGATNRVLSWLKHGASRGALILLIVQNIFGLLHCLFLF